MGYMKSVDIVLTAHKLSDAQKNAVVELLESPKTTAKPNTIKSLENKGLIFQGENGWYLEGDFDVALRSQIQDTEKGLEVKAEDVPVEELVSMLQGDPWKLGDVIAEDEVGLEFVEAVTDAPLAGWELKVMATNEDQFEGDVLAMIKDYIATVDGWKGIEVWDSLSLEEIKEDIETATPVNRNARRTHFRTLRNAFRRLNNRQTPDSRKSLKITGKVGV